MPEDDFWHRQNPARLNALYEAYFSPGPRPDGSQGIRSDGAAVGSLSDYLRGG